MARVSKYPDPWSEKFARRRAEEKKRENERKREEAKQKRRERERQKQEKERLKIEAYKKQEKERLKNMERQEKERRKIAQKNISLQKKKVKRLSGCCLVPSLLFVALLTLFIVLFIG